MRSLFFGVSITDPILPEFIIDLFSWFQVLLPLKDRVRQLLEETGPVDVIAVVGGLAGSDVVKASLQSLPEEIRKGQCGLHKLGKAYHGIKVVFAVRPQLAVLEGSVFYGMVRLLHFFVIFCLKFLPISSQRSTLTVSLRASRRRRMGQTYVSPTTRSNTRYSLLASAVRRAFMCSSIFRASQRAAS